MQKSCRRNIAVIVAALIGVSISCSVFAKANSDAKSSTKALVIERDMKIEDCAARGIEADGIIFIYSHSCPWCKKALPIVDRIVKRHGFQSRYAAIETRTDEGREKLAKWGIAAEYVPVLIKDCRTYVGARDEKEYEEILTSAEGE